MEIIKAENVTIARYKPIAEQLVEAADLNKKSIFDYEDKAGNKAARSHVHSMRRIKGEIEKARKAEKASVLELGRRIDGEAKMIAGALDDMIAVHQVPLDEIEEREKQRIADIQERIDWFALMANIEGNAVDAADALSAVKAKQVDESFAEFREKALDARNAAIGQLESTVAERQKYEDEQAELERLRDEQRRREQEERERRIAEEAAELATRQAEAEAERKRVEAEQKAKAEKQEAERAKLEAQAAAERAEREKIEAQRRAEQLEREAEDRAKAEREAEEAEKAQASARLKKAAKASKSDIVSLVASSFGISPKDAEYILMSHFGK